MGGELGFTTPTSAGWIASGMQLQHAHASQKAALPLGGCRPGAMPGQGRACLSSQLTAERSHLQSTTELLLFIYSTRLFEADHACV